TSSPHGGPFALVWDLIPQGAALTDDTLLEFAFDAAQVKVGDDATSLADLIAAQPTAYLGYDGLGSIAAFYEVDLVPPPQPQAGLSEDDVVKLILGIPPRDFVTITPLGAAEGRFVLWFHLAMEGEDESFRVSPKLTD